MLILLSVYRQYENDKEKSIFIRLSQLGPRCKRCRKFRRQYIERTIHLIENEPDILELVDKIKEVAVINYKEADLTLVTAHSSKGLEWEYIEIDDDYVSLVEYIEKTPKERQNLIFINDELNLLYVAVTRATKALSVSMLIMEIISLIKKRKIKIFRYLLLLQQSYFYLLIKTCCLKEYINADNSHHLSNPK
ncbi:ATP-binding domain-containing protein [Providencia rettgeri]|uniref:ATP-binding domain-containing protein n=1 Tax=Providencia rettgeri TaxID=587 RepID=A0A939NB00_PRORE|nr:ATP-binding domain-containing protein [Providencia rettgeri]